MNIAKVSYSNKPTCEINYFKYSRGIYPGIRMSNGLIITISLKRCLDIFHFNK